MAKFCSFGGVGFAVCVLALLVTGPARGEEYKPWALRDHYSFKGEHSTCAFDVQTGEWKVEVEGLGVLIKDAQCEIEYASGKVLRLSSLKAVKDNREPFEGPLGKGTRFSSVFSTPEGLEIDFSVARLTEHPALLVQVTMTNRGKTPVLIRDVRPVVFDPGAVAELENATVVTQARTSRRGNYSVVSGGAAAGLVMFELAKPRMTLGVGLLESGLMNSSIDFTPAGKSWVGAIHCRYRPSLAILPGARVGSDTVWMSLFVPKADEVSQFHAWAESKSMKPSDSEAVPPGWVTAPQDATLEELLRVAAAWSGNSIGHVLVPAGWQEKPGSLEGRGPAFPKNMRNVADAILKLGMKPGITYDPLATDETKGGWVVTAADGTRWLDLNRPEARDQLAKSAAKLVGMGFEFFVVVPSGVPDDVLLKFNVTRAQADLYALQALTDAAGGRAVMPSPALGLGPELAKWREAVRSTAVSQSFGTASGPLQVNTEGISSVSRDLATAMKEYPGPLEITGMPKKDVRRAVGDACCTEAPPVKTAPGGNHH
jgi:hypothetical protein